MGILSTICVREGGVSEAGRGQGWFPMGLAICIRVSSFKSPSTTGKVFGLRAETS